MDFGQFCINILGQSIYYYEKETKSMLIHKKFMAILFFVFFATTVIAQVTISPTSLFIDSQRRFETLLIMNSSNSAQEISLSWEFGYPKMDEDGGSVMIYDDPEEAAMHSAADWLRGFPKNFILEPGARQTIRITAKAPRGLADGTYWSRLKTTSSALSAQVGTEQSAGISAQINFQFNQITSIFFKQGEVNTGIDIIKVRNIVEDKKIRLLANYTKSGNSPFLGTMTAKVFDTSGEVLLDEKIFVSIYYDGVHRIDLDGSALPAGSYDYEISFSSGRPDIPDTDIIPAPTVSARGNFTK